MPHAKTCVFSELVQFQYIPHSKWLKEHIALNETSPITFHMGSQCYLPPDTTQVNAPQLNPSSKMVLDLPTPEGWKAELT